MKSQREYLSRCRRHAVGAESPVAVTALPLPQNTQRFFALTRCTLTALVLTRFTQRYYIHVNHVNQNVKQHVNVNRNVRG